MTTHHVAVSGDDTHRGTAEAPFRSIDHAAQVACPGDTVMVHAGEYREWVRPRLGGTSDSRRITYTAAPGEHVVVKGSERITGWQDLGGGVWRVELSNTFFGAFNPFAVEINGDWIVYRDGDARKHLGEVYLDGVSFLEVDDPQQVATPPERTHAWEQWTDTTERLRDPQGARRVWTATVDAQTTTIWARFDEADPNVALVEINVRPAVFFPTAHQLDYITVRGFELAQAASPWVPPTADQPGLIGPNWAKGWIIEDNVIHDAKCAAISIGKEGSTGHNLMTDRGDRPGYQYQIESVFSARQIGWDREHIGSHIIRRNTIFDCGQNGIVGHLGGVFSVIEDNHIYNIGIKYQFYGHEIAGIKLHAAIDVAIRRNRIHACRLGIWLDWQTQGTRVSRNLVYDNRRDMFVEVSHGPYVVDHNVFGSAMSLEIVAQGGAYVHNLIRGALRIAPDMDRATPYHRPHSTQVAGFAQTFGGDDRFIGNIFVGGPEDGETWGGSAEGAGPTTRGTVGYDAHPSTFDEYMSRISGRPPGTHRRFLGVHQPVYIERNAYAAPATAYVAETEPMHVDGLTADLIDEGDIVLLEIVLPDGFAAASVAPVRASDLPVARLAGAAFESPDGSDFVMDTDLVGATRTAPGTVGPVNGLHAGRHRIRVW